QALAFCLEDAEGAEPGLRLGASLLPFWETRGHLSEGRERLLTLLARPGAQEHTNARANALNGAGSLSKMQGDYAAARSLHQEALAIWREFGDRRGIAACLQNLGIVDYNLGDYASARSLYEESLEIKRELGDRQGVAGSLNDLGNVAFHQGDYESARLRYHE